MMVSLGFNSETWKHFFSLTDKEKDGITSMMLLTDKRDGAMKARKYAVGWKQSEHMPNKDTALLMVERVSIFIPDTIEVKE